MDGPMDIDKEKALHTLQMSFIAKILSTFTHEMKNHLAIIKESSGLIQDIIALGKLPRKKKDAGPILSTLQAIDSQVGRSTHVINILNRFAHRMDSPASTFKMNEIIEELIVLINRMARQRRIALESDFQKNIPSIHGSPYRMQLILYTLLQEKLKQLDAQSKIIFRTSVSDGTVEIRVVEQGNRRPEDGEKSDMPQDLFQYSINGLKGEITRQRDDRAVIIRLPLTKQ